MTDELRLTEILRQLDLADEGDAQALLELVYDELRSLAANHMRRERAGHTLQPTALVHEAYMRLARGGELSVNDRRHFFRLASRAMRQVLVDSARRRDAERRGGGLERVTLDSRVASERPEVWDVLALDQALERLARVDETWARQVELRFFTGLTVEETAEALEISPRKAAKDWAAIRVWLARELRGG
jgi:RNA polymerase sigma factor (TIGR02999 family)